MTFAITRIHVSDVITPATHPVPGTRISNYAYLVRSNRGMLLFDTGLGPAHEWLDANYRPTRHDLPAQLTEHGVSAADIDLVVNCHLHFDHCGGNQFFPRARFVLQRAEMEIARTKDYTIREWFDYPGARFEVVEGEHEIWPGARLIATPGHTPGHQSLVLDGPEGIVVLAGQAAQSPAGFEAGEGSWHPDSAAQGPASIQRIKSLAPRRVLFGHAPGEWSSGTEGHT